MRLESVLLLGMAILFYLSTLVILFKSGAHPGEKGKADAGQAGQSKKEEPAAAAAGLPLTINFITILLEENPDAAVTRVNRFSFENGPDKPPN